MAFPPERFRFSSLGNRKLKATIRWSSTGSKRVQLQQLSLSVLIMRGNCDYTVLKKNDLALSNSFKFHELGIFFYIKEKFPGLRAPLPLGENSVHYL